MGRNAQRRRLPKQQRKWAALGRRRLPEVYIDLVDYIERRWPLTKKQVKRALVMGEVNVNGEVWAYPHFPKRQLTFDDLGRPRIMVEGHADPRRVT